MGVILDKKKSRFNKISSYDINNASKYFWYQVSCTEGISFCKENVFAL